jgi:hypothetical protein
MLLEDGFWRVRHMVKMDAEPFQKRHRKTNTHLHGKQKKILQNKKPYTIKENQLFKKLC